MEQDKAMLPLDARIEGILFWKGESIRIKKLSQILSAPENEILSSLEILKQKLEGRGLILVFKDDEVMLGTAPQMSAVMETLTREDLVKDLGKAGLETISIILYKGPISRAEIDYIRGVQSNFILRNLLVRGLIEKVSKPDDQRSFLYKPTFELLSHLGLSKIEEVPEYENMRKEFEAINKEDSGDEKIVKSEVKDALDEGSQNLENTDKEYENESNQGN